MDAGTGACAPRQTGQGGVIHDWGARPTQEVRSEAAARAAGGDVETYAELTKFVSSLLGLKYGILFAGISTRAPIFGLECRR